MRERHISVVDIGYKGIVEYRFQGHICLRQREALYPIATALYCTKSTAVRAHLMRKLNVLRICNTNPFATSLWVKNWVDFVPQDLNISEDNTPHCLLVTRPPACRLKINCTDSFLTFLPLRFDSRTRGVKLRQNVTFAATVRSRAGMRSIKCTGLDTFCP